MNIQTSISYWYSFVVLRLASLQTKECFRDIEKKNFKTSQENTTASKIQWITRLHWSRDAHSFYRYKKYFISRCVCLLCSIAYSKFYFWRSIRGAKIALRGIEGNLQFTISNKVFVVRLLFKCLFFSAAILIIIPNNLEIMKIIELKCMKQMSFVKDICI